MTTEGKNWKLKQTQFIIDHSQDIFDILGVCRVLEQKGMRGHWIKYKPNGEKIQSPYDAFYEIEAQYWFFKNSFILVECKRCIQA